MRTIPLLIAIAWAVLDGPVQHCLAAAQDEGVALAIVYDTSGSMKEKVRDRAGGASPKYVIANRALLTILNQIQAFTSNNAADGPRQVWTGLITFNNNNPRQAVKLGPFDPELIRNWAAHFSTPSGGTPLGNAVRTAAQALLDCPMPRKHVLVITDGENTVGPDPAAVMPAVNRLADQKQSAVFVHFVAFDVEARAFDSVKKLGATVAGAADETQLNSQLDFILQNQILLEKEQKK